MMVSFEYNPNLTYADLLTIIDAETQVAQDDFSSRLVSKTNSFEDDGSATQPELRSISASIRRCFLFTLMNVVIKQVFVTI